MAADDRYDLGVVGGGTSARLLAILAAAAGRRVVLMAPWLDPDALPRPLPPASDAAWQWIWRQASFGVDESLTWSEFGGRIVEPRRRRVVAEAGQRHALRLQADGVRQEPADEAWVWRAPQQGWAALWRILERRLATLPVAVERMPATLHWRRGVLRSARLHDGPYARRWLVVAPAPALGAWTEDVPVHRVRLGASAEAAWWYGSDGWGWCRGDGRDVEPLREAHVGARAMRPWGTVGCRGLDVVTLPHPAAAPPTAWSATVARAARRIAGKAAAPVARRQAVVYSVGLSSSQLLE